MTLIVLGLIYYYYKYATKTEIACLITLALAIDVILLNG
jgi:hypothetical protein